MLYSHLPDFLLNVVSRREFLWQSALAAATLRFGLPSKSPYSQSSSFLARAFGLTPVFDRLNGEIVGSLAPDSVHRVRAVGDWFVTEHGVVPRTAMQPINAYTMPAIEPHSAAPFWAELIAPSSTARAYCDPRAPIQATFGHGAVVYVRGALTDDRSAVWYELDRGWVTAAHFAPLISPSPVQRERGSGSEGILRLDTSYRTLSFSLGRQALLRSPFYGGAALIPTLTERLQCQTPGDSSGLPWQMRLNCGAIVHGAWDHNQFGLPGGGTDVELAPEVAKALYAVVLENGCIVQIEH